MLPLIIQRHDVPSMVLLPPDQAWQVWQDPSGTLGAFAFQEGSRYWLDVSNVARFYYSNETRHVIAVPHAGIVGRCVRASYFRIVLPLLLQALGYEMLHASAVRTERGVVAFCGDSGLGKTTIAVGLSRRGYDLWADDALMLDAGATIRAIALPFAVRLRWESAELFGLDTGTDEPGELLPNVRHPANLAAVCILNRLSESAGVAVSETSAGGEVLTKLLAHACAFNLADLERKRRMLQRYLTLVSRVPVFEVGVQPDLARLPESLDQLEARVLNTELACAV